MGMAASQSRFLGLTARKTNVEYRGQQINQARTSLANQTANLYNEMLSLKVPTPPVVSDFYSTSYTFEDGDNSCEVISGLGMPSCDIKVATRQLRNYSQEVNSGNLSTVYTETGVTYLNGNRLTKLSGDDKNTTIAKVKLESILQDGVKLNEAAPFVLSNGASKINVTNWDEYQAAVAQGYSFTEDEPNNILYSYTKNAQTCYVQSSYIDQYTGDELVHKVTIPQEFYENEYYAYETKTMTNCSWDKDASGRYATLTGEIDDKVKSIALTYTQEEDNVSYEQAMQDYKYQYAQYQKNVEDINAKTAKIQEQDRTLELQLRECDTEQEAISKELDSVKKVIEDSVDRVFKTFA